MTILLDTGFYIALLDPTDKHYTRALAILTEIKSGIHGDAFTTSLVMVESATLVAIRTRKNTTAIEGMKALFIGNDCIAQVLRPTESTETKAWDLFVKRNQDKKSQPMSFVDCINIVIAQQHHINAIVAFDSHYDSWIRRIQ